MATAKKKATARRAAAKPSRARARIVTSGPQELNEAQLADDIAAVFKRHGVTVNHVSVAKDDGSTTMRAGPGEDLRTVLGAETKGPEQNCQTAPTIRELPAGLNRVDTALSSLDLAVDELVKRLKEAGVLASAPPNREGTVEEDPRTEFGRRLRAQENRVWQARGTIAALLERLEV
jgi:hypothetical protein